MARERRSFERPSKIRDARLFVIATEGAKTEVDYFNGLKLRLNSSRVHPVVLERDKAGESSPAHVIKMLDDFARQYRLLRDDKLWLLIDRDRRSWRPQEFALVARECKQKGYYLAASNPCFELWLLLHFEDVIAQPETRRAELLKNEGGLLKKNVASKMRPNIEYIDQFFCRIPEAIVRARALDVRPKDRWPATLGTRVYLLVGELTGGLSS